MEAGLAVRGTERAAATGVAHPSCLRRIDVLKWALIFAVVALIAGALGFGGIAGAAAGIAKLLFFLFVIGFVIFLVLGIMAGRKITGG
jgi:uncharacterized membrane protein YtjA (UPF0391 family)